jgi:hypothetical protein
VRIPRAVEARGLTLIGYHDLDGNPGFKMGMQQVGERWYLYLGHFWRGGWSVVDVTEPTAPKVLAFLPGPPDTWASQVQVADGLMIGALEKPQWLDGPDAPELPYEEGALVWDVQTDPVRPTLLAHYKTGGTGTHRNFYSGGRYAYLAASLPGYRGQLLVVLDVADPTRPTEVSRWCWPGQEEGTQEPRLSAYLHGPAYVVDGLAYLSYGRVGMVVLDVRDPVRPILVSRLSFGDLGSVIGCHTAMPIPSRDLAVVNSEAIVEGYGDALNYAFVVDIKDVRNPRIISSLPMPRPSPGLGLHNYYDKGGRFGPHNQHHHQGQSALAYLEHTVVMTYFNAGLRIYDITDPYDPVEVAFFVPEDPSERLGPKPEQALVTQFEDVLVDARGYIYCTDKNYGLFVLSYDGTLS